MILLLIRLIHYTYVAVCETFRIRQTLLPTTVIVIGMALPAALQMGFRDGLGQDLQEAITKSPKASELQITATSKDAALTNDSISRLTSTDRRIQLVIPEVTKVVQIPLPDVTQEPHFVSVTLLPTVAGDPYLRFHDIDVLKNGDHGILLSSRLAEQLNMRGDVSSQSVEIQLARQEDSGMKTYAAHLPVRGVADFSKAAVAYVNWDLMDRLEAFHQGEALPEFDWPAMTREASIGYESYLAFSKSPFEDRDKMKLLAHGLHTEDLPKHEPEFRLFGAMQEHELFGCRIFAKSSSQGDGLLTMSASDIERISDVDDVVVPWSEPVTSQINGDQVTLVGLSFRPRWLSKFFVGDLRPYNKSSDEFSIVGPTHVRWSDATLGLNSDPPVDIPLTLINPVAGQTVATPKALLNIGPAAPLGVGSAVAHAQVTHAGQTTFANQLPAVVPAKLLAHLRAAARQDCVFDATALQFRTPSQPNRYFRARVIAADIHSVPELDSLLQTRGYAVISQKTQVQELRNHLKKIHLWSQVVIVTVGLLGFLTLIMTLLDNTRRKQKSIALLMSFGAGRFGICYVFVLRAFLISLLAAASTATLSLLLADALSRYGANCRISLETLRGVCGVSVMSCVFGSFVSLVPLQGIDPASVANRAECG